MKRKRMILTVIIVGYIGVITYTTLFVPVKASMAVGNGETYREYGYYPLWEINNSLKQGQEGEAVSLTINVTAWVIQNIFITLVFISLFYSVSRHYQAAGPPD